MKNFYAQIAQLVERQVEALRCGSSSLSLSTICGIGVSG